MNKLLISPTEIPSNTRQDALAGNTVKLKDFYNFIFENNRPANSEHLYQDFNITESWVVTHFFEAIYLNGEMSSASIPPYRQLEQKLIDFTLPEAAPFDVKQNQSNISDKILDIMLRKSVRRGTKGLIMPFADEIKNNINIFVKNHQPISFVLPTLPFKDQSPFGTGARINEVDLGEYCFFAQMKRIIEAIKLIYPPGAHMTLLCDGFIYADIFTNGNKIGAGQYKAKCESIKNAYGLYNEITLLDMREVFFSFPWWGNVENQIVDLLWRLYQNNDAVKERLDFLARRFVYYVALPNVGYEEAREIYSSKIWPKWIWDALLNSAIKYASIHLTMKKINIVKSMFPLAIRCTVHPKAAAQLPLNVTNSSNDLLPYNGVAVVSRSAQERGMSLFQAIRVRRLCDVMQHQDVKAVYTDEFYNPYYYEIP